MFLPSFCASIAKMYKSKEAGDVCMLVDEQFTLSTQLVQLEQVIILPYWFALELVVSVGN